MLKEAMIYFVLYKRIATYFATRTAGAYGPLVLAPAEGVGALLAP